MSTPATALAPASPTTGSVDELTSRAATLLENGDFEGARDTLLAAVRLPGGLAESVIWPLARALRATGAYDRARDVLQLVLTDAVSVSRARAEEADIAWVQHDYERGVEAALHALRANPGNRAAEITLGRLRDPLTTRAAMPVRTAGGAVLSHVAFYVTDRGNVGDVVLPATVREAVASVREPDGWLPVHAHQVFDQERRELVNETDGLVIGGGGLFLPDTAPNGNSGWQWNVPRAQLDRIEVPIAVMAVGFNLFPGQAFVGSRFRDNLIPLVERARVVGLRNRGSVAQVQRLLPDELAEKVTFLPCPTTVLRHLHPEPSGGTSGGEKPTPRRGAVLINAAFDRSARRFGEAYPAFLARMAQVVTRLRDAGVEVRFAAHLPGDERFVTDLAAEHAVALPVDALYDLTVEDAYDVYRAAALVIGMRGHATMIPFGLGTPVLSLISHPKMRYFLEDIGRPEWGFDVTDTDLVPRLARTVLEIVGNEQAYRDDVAALQLPLLAAVRAGVTAFWSSVGS